MPSRVPFHRHPLQLVRFGRIADGEHRPCRSGGHCCFDHLRLKHVRLMLGRELRHVDVVEEPPPSPPKYWIGCPTFSSSVI